MPAKSETPDSASAPTTIGVAISKARTKIRMSRAELAAAVGIGVNSLWRYETGRTSPSVEMVERISRAIDAAGGSSESPSSEAPSSLVRQVGALKYGPGPRRTAEEHRHILESREKALEARGEQRRAGPRPNLGLMERSIAIQLVACSAPEEAEAHIQVLALLVERLPFVAALAKLHGSAESGATPERIELGRSLAIAVLEATGAGFGLHAQDVGALEYSLARADDHSGPSEASLMLAVGVADDADAAPDEKTLAAKIIERAKEFSNRYRPVYRRPYWE